MIIHNLKRLVLLSSLLFSSLSIVSCGSSSSEESNANYYKHIVKNRPITIKEGQLDLWFFARVHSSQNKDSSYTIESRLEFVNYQTDLSVFNELLANNHNFIIGERGSNTLETYDCFKDKTTIDYNKSYSMDEEHFIGNAAIIASITMKEELFSQNLYIFFSLLNSSNFNYYFSIKDYSVDIGEAS